MPYIMSNRREQLRHDWDDPQNAGELNFLVTEMIKYYWDSRQSYQAICEITGALENVKQEFYRRIAVPYEEKKIEEKGDVY